ncbi:transposase [Brevibacillus composti]|uniref:Transposase n=1 Tax=Brevibacillus composti TaxID=2796470 RepID=A0A7T5EMK3_9BACL|nr:transposase [Brevibacillus composti]QQE75350.1 transposase [Brevibacillus composti]QUO42376.1 transposase [Brevibacillus composti]
MGPEENRPAKCLRSIPGIDLVYAAGILAEIGDIERKRVSKTAAGMIRAG